jgi:hypothetical protein
LLELSRVAVDLGSDLRIIVPITTVDGNKVTLQFMVNFKDAENSEFLKKLGARTDRKTRKI